MLITAVRRNVTVMLIAALASAHSVGAQAREFRLDAGHSDVEFSIGFLGSAVRGRFDGLRGTILYDNGDPTRSAVAIVIDMASLNTGARHRDEHLKSSDFFDVEKFPMAVFRSTGVSRTSTGLQLLGALTLHGVTREIAIPCSTIHAPTADPHGSTLIDFAGHVRLARLDFGIVGAGAHNEWFDRLRAATMTDSVDVALQISGWDTDFDRANDPAIAGALQRIEQQGVQAAVTRARGIAASDPARLKDAQWGLDQTARALAQKERHQDALTIYALEAELYPVSASAHAALGAAYEVTGDTARAGEAYRRALQLDPYETRALVRLTVRSRPDR
jgi:polyisoprenoid-binding protein YceI